MSRMPKRWKRRVGMTEVEVLAFRVFERVSLNGPLQLEELGKLLLVCT
jgi:hypothetical protein